MAWDGVTDSTTRQLPAGEIFMYFILYMKKIYSQAGNGASRHCGAGARATVVRRGLRQSECAKKTDRQKCEILEITQNYFNTE